MTTVLRLFAKLPQPIWTLSFWFVFILLLALTLTPSTVETVKINNIDKLYHLIAFSGFSFLFCRAFNGFIVIKSFFICCSIGIMIEIFQYFIPTRGFSFADMLADFMGCWLGVWFNYFIKRLK